MNTSKDELNLKQLFFSGIHGAASSLGDVTSSDIIIALGCLLAVSIIIAVIVIYKCKRDKDALLRKYETLQSLTLTELETQRDQVKGQLEEVEAEREENKRKLQSVESEITKREMTFDKPEELLKEKENLLREQWKLDETKEKYERKLLDIDKLLELIEILGAQMIKTKKETVDQSGSRETQAEGRTNQSISEQNDISELP